MKTKSNKDTCPHCGTELDEEEKELNAKHGWLTCPGCHRMGCEANCMPFGRGCLCPECEANDREE